MTESLRCLGIPEIRWIIGIASSEQCYLPGRNEAQHGGSENMSKPCSHGETWIYSIGPKYFVDAINFVATFGDSTTKEGMFSSVGCGRIQIMCWQFD